MSVQLQRAGQLTVSGRMLLAMFNGRREKAWRTVEFEKELNVAQSTVTYSSSQLRRAYLIERIVGGRYTLTAEGAMAAERLKEEFSDPEQ